MAEREYKDKFTLDGRLHPQRGATPAKVREAAALMQRALSGDYQADAKLRHLVTAEAFTSSDLAPAVAHLVNLQVIPQLDKPQYSATELATVRTVPDFRPAVLYSLYGDLKGPGLDANGAPVRVPEGTQYPTVTVSGVESFYASLAKRGVRFDFTWEAQVNDTVGFFADMPREIAMLANDAEYAEVLTAILSAGASSTIAGGTLPNGVVVKKNAKISPDAIWQAKREISQRKVNGRLIGSPSGYNVLVSVGTKEVVDFALNQQIVEVVNGNLKLSGNSYYQGALGDITVVESPRFTGDNWAVLPKPGATARPAVDLLKLRGYETPELRARQDGGDASFDTDTKAFRLRYVVGGALWDDKYIAKSNGTEA